MPPQPYATAESGSDGKTPAEPYPQLLERIYRMTSADIDSINVSIKIKYNRRPPDVSSEFMRVITINLWISRKTFLGIGEETGLEIEPGRP